MPLPALAAAGIAAGASLLGNLFNRRSVQDTNAAQAYTNLKLYKMQRADALADWDRNNAYNSPSQQMQRFKEAGLNPNLIYGNMQNSQPIRSVDVKAPDFVAPRIDTSGIPQALSQYYNIQQTELGLKQQEKAIQLADENIVNAKLKNNYDSAFTYNTEVGGIRRQQLQENVDKTIEDWNMTRELRSMNPLKADQLQAQTKSLLNTIKISNLDQQQRAQTNEIIRQAMRQAIRLQGNRYELDKLANEVNANLKHSMINKMSTNDIKDVTSDVLSLIKTLY